MGTFFGSLGFGRKAETGELVAFADNNQHFEVDDDETDKLPQFAGPHKAGPFPRDHRGIELVVFGEVEFFWF
jgi:hypothetical protein